MIVVMLIFMRMIVARVLRIMAVGARLALRSAV
jgi:hypothetical protein